MPYASVSDLPPAVRAGLTAEEAERWLAAFNAAAASGDPEGQAFAVAWAAARKHADEGRRTDSGTGFARGTRSFRRG